jgi:hypothetical protein
MRLPKASDRRDDVAQAAALATVAHRLSEIAEVFSSQASCHTHRS